MISCQKYMICVGVDIRSTMTPRLKDPVRFEETTNGRGDSPCPILQSEVLVVIFSKNHCDLIPTSSENFEILFFYFSK